MHLRILAALALGGALVASGQTTTPQPNTRSLSLQECIDLALGHNLDLQIEHLSADIAGFQLSRSYGAYDPAFSFKARHDFVSEPADFDPRKFAPYFPEETSKDIFGSGLSGQLPLGLSYDFSARTDYSEARTDFRSNPGDALFFPGGIRDTNNNFADLGLTVRQHLLKDFWIDPLRETVLVRRKELKISQQALRFQIMKTVLAVELGYYDLVAARERIRVAEKALELKRQLVAETKRRVETGDLPPLDIEQSETQAQNALTALTAAREAFASQQNVLLGLLTDDFKTWADTDLQPVGALLPLKEEVNRSESFQNALKNRPDLVEARLAVEKSDVVVQFQMNQLFPSLDFVGRYGGVGTEGGLSSTLSDAVNLRHKQYFYGAVVSFPLGNVAARNDYKSVKAARQIAALQLKKAEQEVLLQVADYVNRVQSRYTQLGSTRQARIYAEAALAAEQKKLANGLSTSFIVLELQEILTATRNAEVQALADYNKMLAQLAFAEGSTLEKQHLVVEVK